MSGLALAAPPRPEFGPFIEGSSYEGQEKCSPAPKPGVVAFQRMVVAAYPGTGAGYVSRACSSGGQSEHKEGRAWDWGVNVANAAQKNAADDLLAWLAAEDVHGNVSAMGRRLGVMYAIWNRRIWFPSSGWRTYCVQKKGACREPGSGDVRHPHTDHVHFSFSWAGAYKKTSFWDPSNTLASGFEARTGGGIWALGRNGGVRTLGGAPYLGSKDDDRLQSPAIALESTGTGWGYWMLTRKGRVFAFGDARNKGSINTPTRAATMLGTATGRGYWILSKGGRVYRFGDAARLGDTRALDGEFVALAGTPTGLGYWILAEGGRVHAFGDAAEFGNTDGPAAAMTPTPSGLGYWVVGANGKVKAFGDAASLGSPSDAAHPIVGIVANATGAGYWLLDEMGQIRDYGDAPAI